MPLKIRLTLQGPPADGEGAFASFRHVSGVRGWVYRCLEREDPVLAGELHGDTWPKPIAASPLWRREGAWGLEFSVLLDPLGDVLRRGLEAEGRRLVLGGEEFTVTDVRVGGRVSYDELCAEGELPDPLRIEFVTPTAHQHTLTVAGEDGAPRKQRKVAPLPDPALAFTSWWHKWNCMMDYLRRERIPETLRDYLPLLAVARMAGRTERVLLDGSRPFIGFVGEIAVKLLAPAAVPADLRARLRALARFAEYCGTGVETLRGMGQTRVSGVESSPAEPREPRAIAPHEDGSRDR